MRHSRILLLVILQSRSSIGTADARNFDFREIASVPGWELGRSTLEELSDCGTAERCDAYRAGSPCRRMSCAFRDPAENGLPWDGWSRCGSTGWSGCWPALHWLAARRGRAAACPAHLVTGIEGENAAFFYLRRKGYMVVARRWSAGNVPGDLDLIAWQGRCCALSR